MAEQLHLTPPEKRCRCPVCGYPDLYEPAYDEYGYSSFEICPCCGTEFGYDDATRSHAQLRQKWSAAGATWHSSVVSPPDDWSALKQLAEAGFTAEGEHRFDPHK